MRCFSFGVYANCDGEFFLVKIRMEDGRKRNIGEITGGYRPSKELKMKMKAHEKIVAAKVQNRLYDPTRIQFLLFDSEYCCKRAK